MESTQNCTSCQTDFPHDATFCPYCGAQPKHPFNKTLVGHLLREPSPSDTMKFDPVEDFRPGRGYGVKLFVGIAITAAVIAGVFVGSWLANVVNRPMVAPQAAITEPAAEAVEESTVPEIVVSMNSDGGFDIMRGAEVIHTVATSNGSRYSNLDERMRSVAVRFKHIQSKGEGRFAARLVGDHHELVWTDPSGDFRLLDVTPTDVKAAKTSTDFVANYLADRLNADLPQPHNS